MITKHPRSWLGYLMAAGAAVMWGVSGVIARYLIGQGQHQPTELLFFRTSLAAIALIIWAAVRGARSGDSWLISRGDVPLFLLMGGIGLVANQGLYYLALAKVDVGYALLFQYLSPVMLMGYGLLTRTEQMTGGKLLAATTAVAGCALMVLGNSGGAGSISVTGTLLAIGSGIGFAFYAVLGKHLQGRYSTIGMMAWAFLIAALIWALINPAWALPWSTYKLANWSFFLYLATFATVIPFGLFLFSLRYIEASQSSLTSMVEPVVAAAVAWLWLDERLTFVQIIGGVAVISAVILLQVESLLRSRLLRRA